MEIYNHKKGWEPGLALKSGQSNSEVKSLLIIWWDTHLWYATWLYYFFEFHQKILVHAWNSILSTCSISSAATEKSSPL